MFRLVRGAQHILDCSTFSTVTVSLDGILGAPAIPAQRKAHPRVREPRQRPHEYSRAVINDLA